MSGAGRRTLPKWPLRLALSLVFVVEIFFTVMFSMEGLADNVLLIANSVGILVFCILIWLGVPWGRWLLIAFLVWRVAGIAVSLSSHFGDHRTGGSLILMAFYLAVGVVAASPLGRPRMRAQASSR